jgi:hypothetical protein
MKVQVTGNSQRKQVSDQKKNFLKKYFSDIANEGVMSDLSLGATEVYNYEIIIIFILLYWIQSYDIAM